MAADSSRILRTATALVTRPQLGPTTLTVLVALFLTLFDNASFWKAVFQVVEGSHLEQIGFLLSIPLLLTAIFTLLISMVGLPYLLKPVAIALLLFSAAAGYFMDTYGIGIDRVMVQNVVETNMGESLELVNAPLLLHLLLFGVIPAIWVYRAEIRFSGFRRELLKRIAVVVGMVVVVAGIVRFFYPDYASLTQNNRYIRHLINPTNYLHAVESYVRRAVADVNTEITPIGQDARLAVALGEGRKRNVVVLVVGETARAANFALNGYGRETTPRLAAQAGVINFGNVYSCGTSTSVSVPCIFSHLGRSEYGDSDKRYEGLLDVLARAQVDVLWRDNNSGCKGACDRVRYEDMSHLKVEGLCNESGCYDEVMLKGLEETISGSDKDLFIVLHQLGSHGPAYYLRTPEAFKRFKPECATNQLQSCSREALVNAYDNTILYTDHFVGQVIDLLGAESAQFNTALMYVSDHGESLGEGNIYLHGMPYVVAPEEQKHVPMVMWFSEGYARDAGVNRECLSGKASAAFSQDNLFHTALGMMGVETSVYDPQLDILNGCRG